MNVLFAFALFTSVVAIWGVPELRSTRVGLVQASALPAGTEALAQRPIGGKVVRVGDRATTSWGQVTDALVRAPAGATQIVTEAPASTVSVDLPADPDTRGKMVSALRA